MVFNKFLLTTFVSLFFVISIAFASDATAKSASAEDVQQQIKQVDLLYQLKKEELPADQTLTLANQIIKNRQLYSGDTVAKVFSLLANLAMNKSDFARAFQFASDGLSVPPINVSIKLELQLIIAKGFYTKGKFAQVLAITNQAINLAEVSKKTDALLLFLAYRSMAYALLEQHQNAFSDLQNISEITKNNKTFSENINLLEILAAAYYFLSDYQMVVDMYQKILKLRVDLKLEHNLAQNYYNLARAYHKLGLLDDAYNAYWQASQRAKKNSAPIPLAFTSLGLGKILYLQKDYQGSYDALIFAEKTFEGKGLPSAYLNTLIALAKSSLALNKNKVAAMRLMQAEILADKVDIISDQIELYTLLASKYEGEGNEKKALINLNKYVDLVKQKNRSEQEKYLLRKKHHVEGEKNKLLVIQLAKESELSASYTAKFKLQQQIIIVHTLFTFLLLLVMIIYWFKQRSKRFNRVYEEIEKPLYFIESPVKTKQIYHQAYKQARKYNYPLSIGYLSVLNWDELSFHFNEKTLIEVSKTIATLINEHLDEFDHVGLINHGEYLLLFPHQTCHDVQQKVCGLKAALSVRFFANLGEFSVNIGIVCKTPTVQDIDPYMFLARLSEGISESEGASVFPVEVE